MTYFLKNIFSVFVIPSDLRWVVAVSIALFFLRLIFVSVGPIDLSPDEAHYWEWSRYLDWSYYSKPPMTAWLNYISTYIFGNTHLGVRFFSCLGLSLIGFMAFILAKNVQDEKAGWVAFCLIHITPLFAAGGLMMTPDIPSLTLWAFALCIISNVDFSVKALSIKPFILLGVVVGFAGLSKYTVALFYPFLGLYLFIDPQRRQWLLKPHVYIAGVISFIMQVPVFYWNFTNDFVGFKHVLGQNASSVRHFGLKSFTNFLEGQLGVLTPVTFILLLCAWVAVGYNLVKSRIFSRISPLSSKLELLWLFSFPIFFSFLLKSTTGKVQPNWPVLSMFAGFVLLAVWIVQKNKIWKGVFAFGLILSCLLTIIAHDTFIVRDFLKFVGVEKELPFRKDPLKPVLGWRGLGQAVSALAESRVGDDYYVLTTRYQTASSLSFYMKNNPKVLYVNLGHRRQNQYDYWDWPKDIAVKPVIYVRENGVIEAQIFKAFTYCAELGQVASRRGEVLMRQANVYTCFGYRGINRKMPEKY